MRRRPGEVRRGKGAMAEGEGLGEEGVFGVTGGLEVDFEGGEGMADGGKLLRVCNIYPIGKFFFSSIRQEVLSKCALQHRVWGTNK